MKTRRLPASSFRFLQESWAEVLPSEDVRAHAGRLLRIHPMRSSGALQLGSGVALGRPAAGGGELVAYDRRLKEAARLEGLTTRP